MIQANRIGIVFEYQCRTLVVLLVLAGTQDPVVLNPLEQAELQPSGLAEYLRFLGGLAISKVDANPTVCPGFAVGGPPVLEVVGLVEQFVEFVESYPARA